MHRVLARVLVPVSRWIGLELKLCLALVLIAGLLGGFFGFVFPKFTAVGILQTSGILGLGEFKVFQVGYASRDAFDLYLKDNRASDEAAARLSVLVADDAFWKKAVTPVLPFEKKDQKEFGDLKDMATPTLLGVAVTVDAKANDLALQMHGLLADYVRDSIIRERVRGWAVQSDSEAAGIESRTRAELARINNEVVLAERRVADMRALIAKYPDSKLLDSRQLVSVGSAGGEARYLSPMAQLIGAESTISSSKEQVLRLERELRIKRASREFYSRAVKTVNGERNVAKMFQKLNRDVADTFGEEVADEAIGEARDSIASTIARNAALVVAFDVRNGASVAAVKWRQPPSLAVIFAVLVVGALATIGVVRYALASARAEDGHEPPR